MRLLEHRFGYGLSIFILVVSVLAWWQARQLQSVSAWFPVFVSGAGALVAVVVIAADVAIDRRARTETTVPATVPAGAGDPLPVDAEQDEEDATPPAAVLLGFAKYMLWFAGFAVLFVLFGMPLAVLLWTLGFIRFASRESWQRAAISAVAITVGLTVLAAILALAFPEGLLIDTNVIIPNWRL